MNENLGSDGAIVGVHEASVASASTCDLGTANYLRQNVTGTTTITSFGSAAKRLRILRFSGALTVTHNATSLICPAGIDLLTEAGDIMIVVSDASGNWRVLNHFRARGQEEAWTFSLSDESTAIASGTAKVTWRTPYPIKLTRIPRASLNTASSGGTLVTVDINEGGSTILSTKLTIDNSEKTSVTAAATAVLSDTVLADDAEITFDIDQHGSGAKGLKVTLYGVRIG